MKFTVTYNILGKYKIEIEANNVFEAEEKADKYYQEADFGDLSEIAEGFIYSVTGGGETQYES